MTSLVAPGIAVLVVRDDPSSLAATEIALVTGIAAPLSVLLIEDAPNDVELVARALGTDGRSVDVVRVEDEAAMRAALAGTSFDLVISHWLLSNFSGASALAILRELGLDLPFIVVAGSVGEEVAAAAIRAGAHDWVLKDKIERLGSVVEREMRERDVRAARRRADAALARQASRFRALIDRSDDGITLADETGALVYASPGARRILGIDDEAIGRQVAGWLHPDDAERVAACTSHVRATPGASEHLEHRIVRPDGTVRWVERTLTNWLADEAVGAVVANFRDVTDRNQSTSELRESEMRFRRLWQCGLVGIAIAEEHGAWFDANDALLAMLGYTRADLLAGGMRWQELTPPEWHHTNRAAQLQLREHGTAPPWEKEYTRKDGSRVPVMVGLASLSGTRNISLVMDLTALKAAEEARGRGLEALARSEGQLRQAQKMEAIGRLAGGVAHDFNNLLSVILSYGEMVLDGLKLTDPIHGDVQEICNAGTRAAALTSQLLLFSRQQAMQPKVLDPNDVIVGLLDMLRRILGEDVDLVFSPAASLGHVEIDPTGIEQVLMNLVVNARDAMPDGGQLTIETADVTLDDEFAREHIGVSAGAHVMVAVSDTGTGMDAATQARIFEPFFTTKGVGKGTGLGLATVFGIVQQSRGTIWVYSEVGQGTVFKVYLPRVDAPVSAEPVSVEVSLAGGREVILLVEDEDAVRTVARTILERAGYKVLCVEGPAQALLCAERHAGVIDLLLTDVVMPHMGGPALAARLVAARPSMKVLFMSGYTDDSVIRHGVLDAGVAYLQKPITPSTLTQRVRSVLKG